MILIPFIFFTLLTGYWSYRHGTLDICVYMSGLYAFTTLLAIFIVVFDMLGQGGVLFSDSDLKFGLLPTLLFCLCIGLCLAPFSLFYGREVKTITIRAPWAVDLLSLMLIAVSLLNLYLVADSTLDILQGDLAKIRSDAYAGIESPAQLKSETLPFIVRFFYYFNVSTVLCLPLVFYNICFRHTSWWWNLLLFFASLSMPIAGIQVADRTEIVFYGEMLFFCVILFYRYIPKRFKWSLAIVGLPLVVAAVAYVVAVTQARFDDKKSSSSVERTIQYAGQGYLNFCFFYERGNFDYLSPEREFPLYHHFFLHKDSNSERRDERMGEQGFFMSIFPTFIGDLLLDISPLGMIVWVIFYFMVVMLVFRRSHREEFDISEILFIYILAAVPIFGIFYYRLFFFTYTFTLILVLGTYVVSKFKFVLK